MTDGQTDRRTAQAATIAFAVFLSVCPAVRLSAQCPDGTPPPCAAAARVPAPPAAERARRFVVIPFRNLSRSPELDWLVEGSVSLITEGLSHWSEIVVVPEERAAPALRRAGLSGGAMADLATLRRIAEATGGWTTITGDMLLTGGRVVVRARALDAVSGRELSRVSAEAPLQGDVREPFGQVAAQLLRAAGMNDPRLDIGAVTTRSLNAYRAYALGTALRERNRYRQAAAAYREAIGYDSSFAQAWAALAGVLLFENPASMFTGQNDILRAIARAQALADRLPPAQRDLILAVGALFHGHLAAAREVLERRIAADSSDVEAAGWLAFIEFVDPLLVATPAGPARRGSLDRAIRLSARILDRDPAWHGPYIPIVYGYLLAAGDLPVIMLGKAREEPIQDLISGSVAAIFVPLLRDTIEAVRIDAFRALPPDSVRAARARALEAARTWTGRWVAAAPLEGAAYQAAARVSELGGNYPAALEQLRVADSLGIEFGYIDSRFQRLAVLGRMRRYADAAALADSLWRVGRLRVLLTIPDDRFDAIRWSFNLFLLQGDARADSLVAMLAASVQQSLGQPADAAPRSALQLLAGRAVPPVFMTGLPLDMRLDALDSAWVRTRQSARGSVPAMIQALAQWAAEDARGDAAAERRVATAAWRTP